MVKLEKKIFGWKISLILTYFNLLKVNIMNKIIISLMIAIVPVLSFAQGGGGREQANANIQAQRVSYIALRLDLSFQEGIFFKDKYYEYEANRKLIRRDFADLKKHPTNDTEANQLILARFKMEEDLQALKRQFYEDLKTQIPSLKLMLLPKAEAEFKEMLVQRLRQNRRRSGGKGK